MAARPALTAVLVCAIALGSGLAVRAAEPAPVPACADISYAVKAEGADDFVPYLRTRVYPFYYVIFSAAKKTTTNAFLEIETAHAAYRANLEGVAIDQPEGERFRSTPVRVASITTEPWLKIRRTDPDFGCTPATLAVTEHEATPLAGKGAGSTGFARTLFLRSNETSEPCLASGRDALVLRKGTLRYPAAARAMKVEGRAAILVSLDRSGRVAESKIYKTSDNADLDEAAREAAAGSLYLPEVRGCLPQAGKYLYVADFTEK